LEHLSVFNSSEQAVANLYALKQLRSLTIFGPSTKAQLAELPKALPNCTVKWPQNSGVDVFWR
jgi:hypothetical protein